MALEKSLERVTILRIRKRESKRLFFVSLILNVNP